MNTIETKKVIEILKSYSPDGETIQHILESIGMDEQMFKQLTVKFKQEPSMRRNKILRYALKGLSCADIDGKIFIADDDLFIEFKSGANLRLHDKEINYRALTFLQSEIRELENE